MKLLMLFCKDNSERCFGIYTSHEKVTEAIQTITEEAKALVISDFEWGKETEDSVISRQYADNFFLKELEADCATLHGTQTCYVEE